MQIIRRIKRKLFKICHPKMGEIWMLHRVTSDRSAIPANRNIEITPEYLEHLIIDYQSKGYKFISLDDVYDIVNKKQKIKENFVCLTFDDGYRDNFEVAYPILKKHNIPFAIYVTTNFYEKKANLWWYVLEDLVDGNNAEFEKWHHQIIGLPTAHIVDTMKLAYPECEDLFEKRKVQMTLDEAQIIELSKESLCTIAAHTMSHPKLDTLPYNEQFEEIAGSKRKLEALIHKPILHFSYPFGAYNDDSVKIVTELGFKTVTKAWGEVIRRGASVINLDRIGMTQK